MPILVKRIYEPPEPTDGRRLLVDRIWPRGVSRQKAAIDEWVKDLAPSSKLRRWFAHDPARWSEFKRRYAAELENRRDLVEKIRSLAGDGVVTLLYSARDTEHNQAVALAEHLTSQGPASG